MTATHGRPARGLRGAHLFTLDSRPTSDPNRLMNELVGPTKRYAKNGTPGVA
jgi:hypothetical protein